MNTLLTDLHMNELSVLIANKVTSINFFKGKTIDNFDSYMLYKDSDGKVEIFERKNPKPKLITTLDDNNCSTVENTDIKKDTKNSPVDIKEIKTISPVKVVKIFKTNVKQSDKQIETKNIKSIDTNLKDIKKESDLKETDTSGSVKPVILMNIPIKSNQLSEVTEKYLRNHSTSSTSTPQLLILPKPESKKNVIKREYLKLVYNAAPNTTEINKRKSSLTSTDVSEPKTKKM